MSDSDITELPMLWTLRYAVLSEPHSLGTHGFPLLSSWLVRIVRSVRSVTIVRSVRIVRIAIHRGWPDCHVHSMWNAPVPPPLWWGPRVCLIQLSWLISLGQERRDVRELRTGKTEKYRVGREVGKWIQKQRKQVMEKEEWTNQARKASRVDKDDTSSDSQRISSFWFSGTSVCRLDCFPETLAGAGFGSLHPKVS